LSSVVSIFVQDTKCTFTSYSLQLKALVKHVVEFMQQM